MKILLLNVHSPDNAGDLAILQETLVVLSRAFPRSKVTVAINDLQRHKLPDGPAYVESFMRWVMRVTDRGEWRWRKALVPLYIGWLLAAALRFRWLGLRWMPGPIERQSLMHAYYDADLVVVVGGGHLYARHAFNIAFVWLWTGISLAILMRKPLVMLPQSFGPLPGRVQQRMLQWLLQRCALVAAREMRSAELIARIGVRRPVLLMPDLAFMTHGDAGESVSRLTGINTEHADDSQRLRVGFTVMDWQGQNPNFTRQHQYESSLAQLIAHLQDRYNADTVLFAQCTGPTAAQDDRHAARRVARLLQARGRTTQLVDAALGPQALKGAYDQLDALVATRMHSAIFSMSGAVPTLVIGYLHKSVGIMETLGLQAYLVDINEVTPELLCERFDALWRQRNDVRGLLHRRMNAMRSTLQHLPVLLRDSVTTTHE
jgi:colanic acid/amylovoran biosynthesis protein